MSKRTSVDPLLLFIGTAMSGLMAACGISGLGQGMQGSDALIPIVLLIVFTPIFVGCGYALSQALLPGYKSLAGKVARFFSSLDFGWLPAFLPIILGVLVAIPLGGLSILEGNLAYDYVGQFYEFGPYGCHSPIPGLFGIVTGLGAFVAQGLIVIGLLRTLFAKFAPKLSAKIGKAYK